MVATVGDARYDALKPAYNNLLSHNLISRTILVSRGQTAIFSTGRRGVRNASNLTYQRF